MNALGVVFSNLHDKNIYELTMKRTMASIPFGGRYRLIDFVLSSMVNSGVSKVGIITKSSYQSLMDHVESGKNWDLARKNGGLYVLPPFGAGNNTKVYENRLEAMINSESFIRNSTEEYIILSDCDNVCNIDYEDILQQHIKKNADATLVYRDIEHDGTGDRIILEVEENERITSVKTLRNVTGLRRTYANIFLCKRSFLLQLIQEARINGYVSFSRDVLAKNKGEYRFFGYKFNGYFANIGNLSSYLKSNLELLSAQARASLFLEDRPIRTKVKDSAPARFFGNAKVSNSLIADGCIIDGTVINSVLFRGCHVKAGAIVENCVLMQDTVVSKGSRLSYVITDKNVIIKDLRTLSGCEELPYFVPKSTII